jgi:hypothetical protein
MPAPDVAAVRIEIRANAPGVASCVGTSGSQRLHRYVPNAGSGWQDGHRQRRAVGSVRPPNPSDVVGSLR